ncbi:hypothetical protein [Sinorhizobium fredii]|uniref:hypothetical protein n=1 Tax=Rhizobium fredii TaxID=380 RepID=UPI003515B1CE
MQSIRATFTTAARGETLSRPGFSIFWMMVLAIVILDDIDARERKRKQANKPQSPS